MPEPDPLLALFAHYNPAVWPLQPVAWLGALAVVAMVVVRPSRLADRLANAFLAALWLVIGVVFHGVFVRTLDPTQSVVYAAAFVAQAALFVALGVVGGRVAYRPTRDAASILGWVAIAYALVVYPLIGIALGHPYPQAPLFGAAPCPTTIFTFGILLLARPPVPRVLLLVPLAWAVVATPAAVGRGVLEDVALLGVALAALALMAVRGRRPVGAARSAEGPVAEPVVGPVDSRAAIAGNGSAGAS
jgi:hypothetical protein